MFKTNYTIIVVNFVVVLLLGREIPEAESLIGLLVMLSCFAIMATVCFLQILSITSDNPK